MFYYNFVIGVGFLPQALLLIFKRFEQVKIRSYSVNSTPSHPFYFAPLLGVFMIYYKKYIINFSIFLRIVCHLGNRCARMYDNRSVLSAE